MRTFSLKIVGAVLAASLMGATAQAGSSCDCTVSVEPEMLKSEAGLTRSYALIEKKVIRTCRRCTAGQRGLRQRAEMITCQNDLMADILAQIDHGPLIALFEGGEPIRLSAN